jgi:hypothetical protein
MPRSNVISTGCVVPALLGRDRLDVKRLKGIVNAQAMAAKRDGIVRSIKG